MIQLIGSVGAILAGCALLLSRGLPLLTAHRTGVLVGKGYSAQRIDRAVDPERFEALMKRRRAELAVPLIVILVGSLFLAQFVWLITTHVRP